MKKAQLIPLFVLLFLLIGTAFVVLYGRGYRFTLDKGKPDLSGTGLLVVTSEPNGAQVFINDHLTTATDNTINLSPATYEVKIFKEGYFPWKKKIKVQKEVVAKAEGTLFPVAPSLENITAEGADTPVIDPSYTKIAYTITSQTPKKNGIYVLDMSARRILTLQSASLQIADDTLDTFSKASLSWSPDGKNILATTSSSLRNTTYLLSASTMNENPQDVTETLALVKSSWEKDESQKLNAHLNTLKPTLRKAISENFNIISWAPDETKILYEASNSATLPLIIKPRLLGVDSTDEERTIKKGQIYVYDIKEDKNFQIDSAPPKENSTPTLDAESNSADTGNSLHPQPLNWFPDSKHLVLVKDKKISIMEYDGSNQTTIYAGPFIDNYVFPWPNGSKIVVLTNLNNPGIPANLYAIGLK